MAAPERFAELSDFSLAPRAPSIHGPSRDFAVARLDHTVMLPECPTQRNVKRS